MTGKEKKYMGNLKPFDRNIRIYLQILLNEKYKNDLVELFKELYLIDLEMDNEYKPIDLNYMIGNLDKYKFFKRILKYDIPKNSFIYILFSNISNFHELP